MKNILFATTALVATAGFASAEVTGSGPGTINITGSAEMGVIGGNAITYDDNILSPTFGTFDEAEIEAQFHTDIDVTFAMSGTADNGLTFGATVDLDENGAFGNTTEGGETLFVSAGGATLTMGDTDGAFDAAMREVNVAAGSINDDETAHAGFSGNGGISRNAAGNIGGGAGWDAGFDGQIARFDYAMSGFTGSLSAEIDDSGTLDPIWGVGVRYAGEFSGVNVGFGLGHQTQEDLGNWTGVSIDVAMANGFTAAVNHSVADLETSAFGFDDATHTGVGIGYEMNALAVGVNYGIFRIEGDDVASGYGIAATYDLGGGLSAQAGYGHSTFNDLPTTGGTDDLNADSFSIGLAMSF